MARLVPRAVCMALLASAPFLGCSSDTPLAPDADTEQSVVPQSKAVQVVPDEYIVLFEESVADPLVPRV